MLKYIILIFLSFFIFACSDSSNNDTSLSSSNFLSISKAPIADDAPVSTLQMLSLEFSVALNPQTVTDLSVYIKEDDSQNAIGSQLSLNDSNTKVTIKPYTYLKPKTSYTFVITTDVQSADGLSLSTPYTHAFATKDDSTDDGLAVSFNGIKPSASKTDVPVQTNISIQFSKNIAPIGDTEGLIILQKDDAVAVAGSIDFFNSIVTFTPNANLDYGLNYTITLDTSKITDMHGNGFDASIASWNFTTIATDDSTNSFKSLANLSLSSNPKKLLNIEAHANDMIAVVYETSIDFVDISINAITNKPTLTLLSTYEMDTTIYSSHNFDNAIFIATSNKFTIIEVDENATVSIPTAMQPMAIEGNIYDFALDSTLYAVGPKFGFKVYNFDNQGISDTKDANISDTIPMKVELSKGSNDLDRIFVADYNGGVNVYDTNGTYLSKTELSGSTRDIHVLEDKTSGDDVLLYVSNSIGKVDFLDNNGSLDTSPSLVGMELISSANSIDSFLLAPLMVVYVANKQKREIMLYVVTPNGTLVDYITTDKETLSVKTSNLGGFYPVLATIDAVGKLNVFNAMPDMDKPTVSSISVNGGAEIHFSEYLDIDSFSKEDFKFYNDAADDTNQSKLIDFNMSISSDAKHTMVLLSPNSNTVCANKDGECYLTITSSVEDLVGNSLLKYESGF